MRYLVETTGLDGADMPTAFAAVTANLYRTPGVRPVTVQWVTPDVEHVLPPGDAVTV